jgi:hypothetical protein
MCAEIGRSHGYPYALGAAMVQGGQVAFLRGDLAAATTHLEEANRILSPREERQVAPFLYLPRGWIARAEGDDEEELRWYLEALELLGDDIHGGMVDELLSETVRALIRRGRAEEATPHLENLRRVTPGRPNAEGFLWWAEGVADGDPAKLRGAAERFAELTRPIDEGRVLLDLADLGVDPAVNRARARELFTACGAEIYVRQVPTASG